MTNTNTDYSTLRLTSPMMHGPAVKRLQEWINLALGNDDLEEDGVFGGFTHQGVWDVQKALNIETDYVCGSVTWSALLRRVESMDDGQIEHNDFGLIDRIGKHQHPKGYMGKRPWSQITGVTLHQTGCGGNRSSSGWDRINAHGVLEQDGRAILVNDPTDLIAHGKGFNPTDIGIEVVGNFCGIDGDMKTLWKGGGGPHHLNMAMLDGAERIRLWLVDQFAMNGANWDDLHAHRQSTDSRIADPGEEIWKMIARPWLAQMGLTTGGLGYYTGHGRPLPKQWGNCYDADYYCKPGGER